MKVIAGEGWEGKVLLDGEPVDWAFEADDEEGYVRVFLASPKGVPRTDCGRLMTEFRYGKVTLIPKPTASVG